MTQPFPDQPALEALPPGFPPVGAFVPVATEADILACFRLILGRDPNPEERAGHMAQVGHELGAVVANYVGSAEFAARNLVRPAVQGEVRLVTLADYRIYVPVEDEAVGRHVAHGVYDPHVATVLRQVLRPGMGMLDLGANLGVFALLGAALVGPAGRVIAVEPNGENARLLEASRLANGFGQLTVVQAAASDRVGVLALHSFGSNGTASAAAEEQLLSARTVTGLPVDRLLDVGDRMDLVKIDVEGAEYLALCGTAAMLRRCRPVIVSEFSPGQLMGVTGPEYLGFLTSLGYQLAVLERDGTYRPGQSAVAIMDAYERSGIDHIDLVAVPESA